MAGSAPSSTRACSWPVNPAAVSTNALDTCLTQGVKLDLALSDVLVFGDQNPAPSADLGEPLEVWCATPEGVVLHVREMTLGEQHSRDGTGRHALINEKLVRVVRRRGRA